MLSSFVGITLAEAGSTSFLLYYCLVLYQDMTLRVRKNILNRIPERKEMGSLGWKQQFGNWKELEEETIKEAIL